MTVADIDRLIRALTEAQADPTEEAVTRCLGMARAVKTGHEQALASAADAAADEVWRERVDAHQSALQNLFMARADAERVRRGARCLRERCRRLESRARGAEERAGIEHTAALYAWRMLFSADYPPFGRGAMLDELHRRVASDYGAEFAAAGKASRLMVDVLGVWREEEVQA